MQTSMGSVTGRIWGSNSLMAMHGFGSSLRQSYFCQQCHISTRKDIRHGSNWRQLTMILKPRRSVVSWVEWQPFRFHVPVPEMALWVMVRRKLWAVAQQSKSNSQAILKNSALIELCLMSAFTELCHPRMSFLAWPLIHCQQHYQVAVFRVHAEGKKIWTWQVSSDQVSILEAPGQNCWPNNRLRLICCSVILCFTVLLCHHTCSSLCKMTFISYHSNCSHKLAQRKNALYAQRELDRTESWATRPEAWLLLIWLIMFPFNCLLAMQVALFCTECDACNLLQSSLVLLQSKLLQGCLFLLQSKLLQGCLILLQSKQAAAKQFDLAAKQVSCCKAVWSCCKASKLPQSSLILLQSKQAATKQFDLAAKQPDLSARHAAGNSVRF